jgi:ABC-type amino acid transport substrate-binding protein
VALTSSGGSVKPEQGLVRTSPYYHWRRSVLVGTSSGARSLRDVQGQAVCAVAGDYGEAWLMGDANPGDSARVSGTPIPSVLITRQSDAGCVDAVLAGAARALVTSTLSPAEIATDDAVRVVAEVPAEPRSAFVSDGAGDATRLRAAVEGALSAMRSDGTLAALSVDHFGVDLASEP